MARDFHDDADYEAMDRDRRADAQRRNDLVAEQEAREAAEIKVRVDARSVTTNERMRIAEYENAGVTPPYTNDNGVPTVTLGLLFQQGWRIEEINGLRTLVQPNGRPRRPADNQEPDRW